MDRFSLSLSLPRALFGSKAVHNTNHPSFFKKWKKVNDYFYWYFNTEPFHMDVGG